MLQRYRPERWSIQPVRYAASVCARPPLPPTILHKRWRRAPPNNVKTKMMQTDTNSSGEAFLPGMGPLIRVARITLSTKNTMLFGLRRGNAERDNSLGSEYK